MTAQISRPQAGLLLLCALLLTATILALALPIGDWTPPAPHGAAAMRNAKNAEIYVPPPRDSFSAINLRPVFNPTRAAIASADDTPQDGASDSVSDLSLVGIISDGKSRLAIIRTPRHPLAVAVPEGSDIEGWQVTQIDADRITLTGKGGEQELHLSAPRLATPPVNQNGQ